MTTLQYGAGRADLMLKTMGVQVQAVLGPRPISQQLINALTINVKNEIGSLTASAQQKVSEALIQGVNDGVGPKVMAKNISEATGMERARAVTIARTETMRANVSASVDRFKRYGVDQVQWLVAEDDRLCDDCNDLSDKVYDIDEAPDCPLHPNCRCVLIPYIEEGEDA